MADEGTIAATETAPAPKKRWSRWRLLWLIPVLLIGAVIGGAVWLDSAAGHRFIVRQIAALKQESGLCFSVGRIDGSIYNKAVLHDVTLCDPQGVFLRVKRADLAWYPFSYIGGRRLSIDRLVLTGGYWERMPALKPSTKKGPILPDFDIFIGELTARKVVIGEKIAGRRQVGNLTGSADIRDGRARINLNADTNGDGDRLMLVADISPDDDRFDLKADIAAPVDGVLVRVIGIDRPLALSVNGKGSWKKWNGRLLAKSAEADIADVSLTAMEGRYKASGYAVPGVLIDGMGERLTQPRLGIDLGGSYADRIAKLDGTLSSQAFALTLNGGYDFAINGFDAMRLDARVLQPGAFLANMTAANLEASALLDGPLESLRLDYRASAAVLQLGSTGFTNLKLAGTGQFREGVGRVPLRLSASRVTGTGEIAERVLTDLSADGMLMVDGGKITGRGIVLRTRQIDAGADINADLGSGQYDVALNGRVNKFGIPSFGVVDAVTRLTLRPAAGGGVTIAGNLSARMSRLDNNFLRTVAGGLPSLTTKIGMGPDFIFRFNDFVLNAPKLRFVGSGVRNRDGTFNISGNGRHADYGPLRMTLAGVIDRPKVVLDLESPLPAAGLKNVRAVLDPDKDGFAYTVAGQSMLGPFSGNGAILLPTGGDPLIRVDRLLVTKTVIAGTLRPSDAGIYGDFTITGGGVDGTIKLAPRNGGQAIEALVNATDARFGGESPLAIRRAKIAISGFLEERRITIDATVEAQGISQGSFVLGRLAANAKIVNGTGRVVASMAGTRGSTFEFQTTVDVSPARYVVNGRGTYQRREIRLVRPAVVTVNDGVIRLAPATLSFGGGSLRLAALMGGGRTTFDARMDRLPLQLADLFSGELGFGGRATGVVTYVDGAGPPTAGVKLKITGLTRSGLLLSSSPIDIALNGQLDADSATLRAVIANGGKNIGQIQGQVSNLPALGGLAERIVSAPVFAQARFNGEAGTLWRLTGVELFDLSGPVSLGADITGTLSDPQIRGEMRTENARLESGVTGSVVANIKARGTFTGSQLVIRQMTGTTRGGGTLSAVGIFNLSARGLGIALDIDARNAELLARDDLGATVTGPLRIRSSGNGGIIAGKVTLDRSSFKLGQAAAAEALPQVRVREVNARADAPLPTAVTRPWRLDIRADAPNQMAVTGLGLDSEWRADLQIGGQIDNPRILGTASLVRGFYEFAGKSFRLERGQIRFNGEIPVDPTLDIAAVSEVQGIDATITVRGTGQRPEIAFTSVPAMPEDELLSRILFGSSITNISAAEALQLAAAVASLRGGDGGLDPINAVRKAVGLDRLRILPADQSTGQGTAVAAGKYITRRTYVELVSDGKSYNATRVEFQITRWLSILGSISTIGRQSVNARVSKDY